MWVNSELCLSNSLTHRQSPILFFSSQVLSFNIKTISLFPQSTLFWQFSRKKNHVFSSQNPDRVLVKPVLQLEAEKSTTVSKEKLEKKFKHTYSQVRTKSKKHWREIKSFYIYDDDSNIRASNGWMYSCW